MPADHSKFLYTIIKQLDLKSIDWAAVAGELGITNGHAARMRFSRFKQAMEGVVPAPRRRTTNGGGAPRSRRVKNEKDASKRQGSEGVKPEPEPEPSLDPAPPRFSPPIKPEPIVKQEEASPEGYGCSGDLGGGVGPGAGPMDTDVPASAAMTAAMSRPAPLSLSGPGLAAPSRTEFGPFAGTYPPPGAHFFPNEQRPGGLIKAEPAWNH
ncbi:MAG: hypothetical protein M1826_006295 [Phylliscum demangeonii]|nr:MAG: hypothetical protein M1826_006295 [Phylliscum demangeonii]